MEMTKTANKDAEVNPTTSAANTLRTPNETAAIAHDPTFFGLPREVRDQIYGLAALSEHTLYRDIILRAGSPPQKSAHVGQDAHRTFSNSQFEIEYSAAAEVRVKSLMNGGDRSGFNLCGPGARNENGSRRAQADEIWLEMSKEEQEDGKVSHNVHALMLAIPLAPFRN